MKIVITGNPNSGKTTLFNALTKSSQRVGNWHGVTVNIISKSVKINGESFEVVDLPGLNSFNFFTMEEKVSIDYLNSKNYDLILNVIEAVRFDESIELTKSLEKLNKPMICIVNMDKDLVKLGGKIDYESLNKSGLDFYKIDLSKRSEITKLKDVISNHDLIVKNRKIVDYKMISKSFYEPRNTFNYLDKTLVKKRFALPLFLLLGLISLYLSFGNYGLGKLIGNVLSYAVDNLGQTFSTYILKFGGTEFTSRLVNEGVIKGFSALLGFLPSFFVLNFVLCYLEHSGLIARFSYSLNDTFKKMGLNGRSLFSLIVGLGCTAVAVNVASGLENKRMKRKVISILPCVGCSAKLSVYYYLLNKIIPGLEFFVIAVIYIIALLATFSISKIIGQREEKASPLIIEMPILRMNCLKSTFKSLINSVKQFIIKISTVIVCASVLTFLLSAFSPNLEYLSVSEIDKSLIAYLGGAVSVILKPIGVCDYKIGASLLLGLVAKEAVVSTLAGLSFSGGLSFSSGIALTVFFAFYPPCVSSLSMMKSQIGFKETVLLFFFETVLALILAYSVRLFILKPFIFLSTAFCLTIIFLITKRKVRNENFLRKRKQ